MQHVRTMPNAATNATKRKRVSVLLSPSELARVERLRRGSTLAAPSTSSVLAALVARGLEVTEREAPRGA